MDQSQAKLLAKSDSRLVRLFSASCISAFKLLWNALCGEPTNTILENAEKLLWRSIERPNIKQLDKLLETIKHLPELEDHYADAARERLAYASAFVFCPGIVLFVKSGDVDRLLHISNTCISLSRELDALTGVTFGTGRKTRAVVEHPAIGDFESRELERQQQVLELIQQSASKFESLVKSVRTIRGVDAVATAKSLIERVLA